MYSYTQYLIQFEYSIRYVINVRMVSSYLRDIKLDLKVFAHAWLALSSDN